MLTAGQRKDYNEQGYLLLPGVFTEDETKALAAEADRLADRSNPQRVMERDGENVRAVYGVHHLSDTFDRLTRDRRAVEPARELLGSDVYIHQTQLNPKAPLVGDVWEWHQDFLYWARDDGMPKPDVLSAAIFFNDVTEFNGQILVIPGSHKLILENETTRYADGWETAAQGFQHRIGLDTLRRIAGEDRMVSVRERRGSILIFHGCVLHCSTPNLSPFARTVLFIRYNSIKNTLAPIANPRPEWVACRNPKIVAPLAEPFSAPCRSTEATVWIG